MSHPTSTNWLIDFPDGATNNGVYALSIVVRVLAVVSGGAISGAECSGGEMFEAYRMNNL